MSEKFSLKWNDFQSNISKTFSSLRTEEEFFDVTLVSDDQHQVSAHRVVLSACSQYFKNILKNNRHSNPLLCLDGVTSSDLQFVLDYIYHGEVQIFQENLDRFLAVAERFQLEGLTNSRDGDKVEENYYQDREEHLPFAKVQPKEERKQYSQVKESVRQKAETTAMVNIDAEASNIEEVNQKLQEFIEKDEDGTFSCKLCGKSGVKCKRNLKNHIETHMQGLSFPCQYCGKTFRSRNSLNIHKFRHHRS